MKYYIIAGEASGDLHGANLVKAIFKYDPNADIRAWGGDNMQQNGAYLVNHYKETAVMGYANVIKSLGKLNRLFKFCKSDILEFNPDVVILIDYPGFNLRIAKFAKNNNYKVFYYIAPKIWAWKSYRIKAIKKYVDSVFSIIPFEVNFYKKYNYKINYIGNPLLDAIDAELNKSELFDDFVKRHNIEHKPIIALLPGSRKQEIRGLLPKMLSLQSKFPEYQFVVSSAPSIDDNLYTEIAGRKDIKLIKNDTYQLLHHAQAAIVASGTAVLETALIGTPQVACYKLGGGRLAYFLAKQLIKTPFVTLVNLIGEKEIVPELLQHNFNESRLFVELKNVLPGGSKHEQMIKDYSMLYSKMGVPGASVRAAELMVHEIEKSK